MLVGWSLSFGFSHSIFLAFPGEGWSKQELSPVRQSLPPHTIKAQRCRFGVGEKRLFTSSTPSWSAIYDAALCAQSLWLLWLP